MLMSSKTPTQNSVGVKKLDGRLTSREPRLVKANNQWGMNKTPLIKVSLYFTSKSTFKLVVFPAASVATI